MKHILYSLFFLSVISFFTACSEYGLNESYPQTTSVELKIAGYVADGYISGANICLDADLSGGCSIDETTVVSATNGGYSFGTYTKNIGSLISLVAADGIDTATNKNFVGKFRSIIAVEETTGYIYATPLTDLIATSFLNASVKDATALSAARTLIAESYGLVTDIVESDPVSDVGTFRVAQEIQQTKAMFEVSATKAKGISLTSSQRAQLQEEIKQAIVTQIKEDITIDTQKALLKLEALSSITIPENEKTFINEQIAYIKVDLESFYSDANSSTTQAHLNTYQVALEGKGDEAYAILQNANVSDVLEPFALNIDIFAVVPPDENVTLPPDQNVTIPTDLNISFDGLFVDGYIKDATLCLDLDYDGLCTATEASSSSTESGVFTFTDATVQVNTLLPIIAYGGIDTFTSLNYTAQLKTIISVNDVNSTPTAITIISPLTDMVATDFLQKSEKSQDTFDSSISSFATAFGLDINVLYSDPVQNVSLFMTSQELEHIKRLCEVVIKKTTGLVYNDAELLALREEIKIVLSGQILSSSYEKLDIFRVLAVLDGSLNITIASTEKNFVIDQVAEIQRVLADLSSSAEITTSALSRIQLQLEAEMAVAYANVSFVGLTLTVEGIIYSIFDKTDASYDENACSQNTLYVNSISNDVNITGVKSEDPDNGLTLKSEQGEHILFYPNLSQIKTDIDVSIIEDTNSFYITYDTAWVDLNDTKSIYIQTPQDAVTGLYGCMRAKLSSTTQGDIVLEKVYRYTD